MASGVTTRPKVIGEAREAVLLDYLRLRARRVENRTAAESLARLGVKCWILAPNIAVYVALMDGQKVPLRKLNPDAVRRYGLK